MFSEVYWHHGVRAATAMLQRAFFLLHGQLDLDGLFRMTEHEMIDELEHVAAGGTGSASGTAAGELLHGLFGPTRQLYKRLAQYSFLEQPELYKRLARRPYPWLAACAERFASILSASLGRVIAPHQILFDSPPVALEVQFNIEIFFPKENRYRPLGEVSPVVRTLATEQFDDYVKRVRIFAHPRIVGELRRLGNLPELLDQAITQTE
jgi:uncharacterized protein